MTKQSSPTPGSPRPFGSRDDAPDASRLAPRAHATRIVALGSVALMDGFRLAGIEVMPNATREALEDLLKSLLSGKARALVLVEDALAAEPGPWLGRALSEGGRVVVVQVPALASAGDYHPDVDRLIGAAAQGESA